VEIQADASQSGLGAVLQVDGKVVEYASRAMTEAEKGYAQIEKELLSLVLAVGRWDVYTYGRRIRAYTDHKPLIAIRKKALGSAPKRLQRITVATLRHRAGLPPGQSINSPRHAVESFPTRSGRDSVYGGRRGTSYG